MRVRCLRLLSALFSAAIWIGVTAGGLAAPEGSAAEGKIGVVVRQIEGEAVIDFGTVSPAGSPYIKRQALGAAILSSVDGWNLTVREASAPQSAKGRRLQKGLAVRAGEEWVGVSAEERQVLSGQPATGQKWRQIPIDLRLDVSWDDPPGSYEGKVVIAALPAVSAAFAAADPNPFSPNGDEIADQVRITYHLLQSTLVTARIVRDGLLVREFPPGEKGAGFQVLTWNGRDDNGELVADGEYQYRVIEAGTEEVLAAGNVSVDRTAPKLCVYSPNQGDKVGARLQIEGKTEPRALITARVAPTVGNRFYEKTGRSKEDGSFSFRLPTFVGENVVTLQGQDQAGNRAHWEMTVFGAGTPGSGPKAPASSRTAETGEGEDAFPGRSQALTALSLQCHLQSTARVGDILKLRIQLSNDSPQDLGSVELELDLPAGWTPLKETGGRQLEGTEFAIGRLRSRQTRLVEVPLLVGARSPTGPVAVTAWARGVVGEKAVVAGPNTQTVLVGKGPFADRALIIGRVWHDSNRNEVFDSGEPPLSGATLLLTDGSWVRTDDWGRYSLPDLRPGVHRIFICPDSVPEGSAIPAERLVNLSPGGVWRVDFPLRSGWDEQQKRAVEEKETRGGWHGLLVRSFTWPDDEQASQDGNLAADSFLARNRTLISFQGQLPLIEEVAIRVSQGGSAGESNLAGEDRLPTGDASTMNSAPQRREGFTGSLQAGSWQLAYGGFDPGDYGGCLASWTRTLTGLHGGYRGKLGELKGFIARENSVQIRDVLPVESAFGPYELTRGDIIPGTEQVALVFAGEKSRQPLPRSAYHLDCSSGTLLFWHPLPTGDVEQAGGHLEVSYQVPGGMEQATTWGIYGSCRPPGLYFEGALVKEGGKAAGEFLGGAKLVVERWNHTLTAGWDCMTSGKRQASIRWEAPHGEAAAPPLSAEWQKVVGDSTKQVFAASGTRQLGKGLKLRARYWMPGTGLPVRWQLCFDQYFSRHLTGQLILTRSENACHVIEGKAALSGDWELAGGSSLQVDVSKDCSPGQMPAPASMSIRADVAGPVALEGRIRVERSPGQPEERPMHCLASVGVQKGPASVCLGGEKDGNGRRLVLLGEAKLSSQALNGIVSAGLVRAGDGLPRWRASVDFVHRPRQSNELFAAGRVSWTGGAREDNPEGEFTGSVAGVWKPNAAFTASGKIDWRQTSTGGSLFRTFRVNGRLSYRLNEYWQLSGYGFAVQEGLKPERSGKWGLEVSLSPLPPLEISLGVEKITDSGGKPRCQLVNRLTLAW